MEELEKQPKIETVQNQALIEVLEKFPAVRKRIPIDDIELNWWNSNEQSDTINEKVKRNIEKNGLVDPITVRPHKRLEGKYEIIDGEHRWKICKSLGYKEMDCDVLQVDDSLAQLLTINLNNLRGRHNLKKLAKSMKNIDEDQRSLLPMDEKKVMATIAMEDFDFDQYNETEIVEDEASPFALMLQDAIRLEKRINHLHSYVKDDDTWDLFHRYLEWVETIKKVIKIKKEKEILPGEVPLFQEEKIADKEGLT